MNYQPSLDGLRALAIASVMGFHFSKQWVTGGSLGVDIFFVLSGYLITSILTSEIGKTGGIDIAAFLLRRARRLLPALAILLIAYATLAPVVFPELAGRRWLDVATAMFYVTNLRQTFSPADTPLSPTWSLAIEEQFYIIWPLVLLALTRLPRRSAALLLCGMWTFLTILRILWTYLLPGILTPAPYYLTPLHATGLILGAALALNPFEASVGRAALVGLIALVFIAHTNVSFAATQAIAEIAAAMVIANPPRILANASLRFLGRISYGVYLWHIPLFWGVGRPESLPGVTAVAIASLLAGWLSYVLVERWFLHSANPKMSRLPVLPEGDVPT